jgi:protein NrfD
MKDLPGRWRGESYYGRPALKNPQWDWKVSGYIAVAGTAGGAQVLAWLGELRDRRAFRGARRTANLVALLGTAVGSALLIADLKTPRRFYNMLRILRPTSPMSLGTYILGAFGATSAVAALGELPAIRRRPALHGVLRLAEAGSALSGAGAATYTAALMSATSNPYWAAAPRALGAQFATSAVASGAAVLALGERAFGRARTADRLEAVAAIASLAHLGASRVAERRRRAVGVAEAVEEGQGLTELGAGDLVLGAAAPLAGYALNRALGGRAPAAAVAGSLAVLAAGWLMRDGTLNAGKRAARRPEAAFRMAQPSRLPSQRTARRLLARS